MEQKNININTLLDRVQSISNKKPKEIKKEIKQMARETSIVAELEDTKKYLVQLQRQLSEFDMPHIKDNIEKYIGETMASMFKDNKISISQMEDILYDNHFDMLLFQVYFKTAITHFDPNVKWGLMAFLNNQGKTKIKLVETQMLKYHDHELIEAWVETWESMNWDTTDNLTYHFIKENNRVKVELSQYDETATFIASDKMLTLPKDITDIPIAILNNTPMGMSDIDKLESHFNMIDRLLKSIMDDIDYGKNKIMVSQIALDAFNGKNTKTVLWELTNALRGSVISVPSIRNLGLSDNVIPTSGVIQTDKILQAYTMVFNFIKEMAFIKTSNAKAGAQETDSQVSMQNMQANDMTELKQKVRERFLQEIGYHIAKVDKYWNTRNGVITQDFKSPKDIKVSIELTQMQQQQLEMQLQNPQASKDPKQANKVDKGVNK